MVLPASAKPGDTVTFDVSGAGFVLTLSPVNVPAFSGPWDAIGGKLPTLKVSIPMATEENGSPKDKKGLVVCNLALNGVKVKDIEKADKAALALLG